MLCRPAAGWQPSRCACSHRAGAPAHHLIWPAARRRCAAHAAVESAGSKEKDAVYLSDIIAFEVGRRCLCAKGSQTPAASAEPLPVPAVGASTERARACGGYRRQSRA